MKKFFDRFTAVCFDLKMPKMILAGTGLLTFEHDGRTDTFEVVGSQYQLGQNGWNSHFSIDFPAVKHIETQRNTTKENTITEEEKTQRNLIEAAEKVTREFRSAERELLDQHYSRQKLEAQFDARKLERVGDLRRVINDALDSGVEWEALRELLADEHREHADNLLQDIYDITQLDNVFAAV